MKTFSLLSLLACVLMTGCAAKLVSVDDKLVVVQARRSDALGATDVAEIECQRRGLHARLTTKLATERFGFDCVR